ncbi:3-oxoacyl-[acyl-carrier-protein] reductase [Pollutibacter soli]|uniref:3-oxoacyl-[acyl-carrier-protein] reductase n=1 Tax=Pollutibacter soli TaxID=3034157 RepID=UPI00301404BC
MKLLENKTAIVTGAARGIGEGIACKFAEHGANVAFTYISDSSAEKAHALQLKLEAMGVKAKSWQTNAADYAQSESFVNDVVKEFGTVDICVNNAGISKDNLLLRLTPDQWEEVIRVNLNSVYNLTKQVIRPMLKARSGSIVNVSSIIGIKGNAGQASYAASKAGIIGFTKSIAQELGSRSIRCNAIAPGFIETDMTQYLQEGEISKSFLDKIPLGRFGTSEETANAALFLASDMSSYITGQVLSICGGMNT